MRVLVVSKKEFDSQMESLGICNENVEKLTEIIFISINDTSGTKEVPYFDNKKNVKVMYFDDVEKDMEIPIIGTNDKISSKAMTPLQAQELVQFIKANKESTVYMIHCTAGISRSGAVGLFINEYLEGDKEKFRKDNPYIQPSPYIYNLLKAQI